MLQFDYFAEKYLKYIDELLLSVVSVDKKLQPKIN